MATERMSGARSVQTALEIVRVVARAHDPVTGAEIAGRIGVHQTTASRLLRTLAADGYVRAVGRRGYVPDVGIFALGADAAENYPLIRRSREPMEQLAASSPHGEVTLAALRHGQLLYFLRTGTGGVPVPFSSKGYPLHLSPAAMRLLLDAPTDEAVAHLTHSAQHWGWHRPTTVTPADPAAALALAAAGLVGDSLVLQGWNSTTHLAGAIPVDLGEDQHLVLAIATTTVDTDPAALHIALRDGRRVLEAVRAS